MKLFKFDNNTDLIIKIVLAVSLIIFAVSSRALPHPANFAPIAAVAIFSGALFPRKWAVAITIVAMIGSDLIIGLHPLVLYTWGAFAVIALFSGKYIKHIGIKSVGLTSLGASLFFFVVTNFGVWAEGLLYPRTLEGLVSCYYNALPFFRNTIFGDLVYTALLFGVYVLVYRVVLAQSSELVIAKK